MSVVWLRGQLEPTLNQVQSTVHTAVYASFVRCTTSLGPPSHESKPAWGLLHSDSTNLGSASGNFRTNLRSACGATRNLSGLITGAESNLGGYLPNSPAILCSSFCSPLFLALLHSFFFCSLSLLSLTSSNSELFQPANGNGRPAQTPYSSPRGVRFPRLSALHSWAVPRAQ